MFAEEGLADRIVMIKRSGPSTNINTIKHQGDADGMSQYTTIPNRNPTRGVSYRRPVDPCCFPSIIRVYIHLSLESTLKVEHSMPRSTMLSRQVAT